MKTTSIDQRAARPLRAVISAIGQAGFKKLPPGKSRWLMPLAILCCLVNAVLADTFGLFTYTDNGTSITITDYPSSATGAVVIPAKIPPDTGKPVTSIGNYAFYNCYRADECDNSRRRDKHRDIRVCFLPDPDQRDDSRRCYQHRKQRVPELRKPDQRLDS